MGGRFMLIDVRDPLHTKAANWMRKLQIQSLQPGNFDFLFDGSEFLVTRDKFALPFLRKGGGERIGKT